MIKIGIIKENKIPIDNRTPLTPKQAKQIKNNGIDLVCQTSDIRCFSDIEYKKHDIKVVNNLDDRDIIFGIKEIPIRNLMKNKTYFFFNNRRLRQQCYILRLIDNIFRSKLTTRCQNPPV